MQEWRFYGCHATNNMRRPQQINPSDMLLMLQDDMELQGIPSNLTTRFFWSVLH